MDVYLVADRGYSMGVQILDVECSELEAGIYECSMP